MWWCQEVGTLGGNQSDMKLGGWSPSGGISAISRRRRDQRASLSLPWKNVSLQQESGHLQVRKQALTRSTPNQRALSSWPSQTQQL